MGLRRSLPLFWLGVWLFTLLATASCSYGPAAVQPPSINASRAGRTALEMHDANGDGRIAGAELEMVPGLAAAMETVDTNGDAGVSAEEIAERIRSWQASRIGVATVMCQVTLDGQPLPDATVTFEPESFLGEAIQEGEGVTDAVGAAYPRIPKERRPSPDMPGGLQLGFYRIRVSKIANGKELIPAIYNTETTLGQQIAPDDPAIAKRQRVILELKSR